LTFEEEEAEAKLLLENNNNNKAVELPPSGTLASTVYISAGGKATESFVRALLDRDSVEWKASTGLGQYAVEHGKVVGLICPALGGKQTSQASKVDRERMVAEWLFSCQAEANSALIVLGTAAVFGESFAFRTLSSTGGAAPRTKRLETGRMLSSFPATLMERALLQQLVSVTCYVFPREPVLSMETMESLKRAVKVVCPEDKTTSSRVQTKFKTWARDAMVQDEKESRLTEPEGMFM
jgi:hypothetical protein